MTKHTVSIDADESVKICSVGRACDASGYNITVFATGGFGSGTVTIQASPDSGTTKVTLKDVAGSTVSITSDDVYNIKDLGYAGINGEEIEIYATMSGSTTPTVTVAAFDNR
jgi:hypothetical protein